MRYDVIVIGAGPGGCAAATFLSKNNNKVLLLDKAIFPRNKTCGDGLTPRGVSAIERLGVLDQVKAVGQRIERVNVIAPNGSSMTNDVKKSLGINACMLAVPRYDLDSILVKNAVSLGATLKEGCKVTRVTDKTKHVLVHGLIQGEVCEFSAKYVIIATGANMGLLKKLGFLEATPNPIIAARAYYENANFATDHFNFHFNEVRLPGYGWVFSLPENKINVGVGIINPQNHNQKTKINIKSVFDEFTNSSYMKQVLSGAKQLSDVQSYPIRTDFLTVNLVKNRILLVGEAAGLVNPLTGEGIDYAMECGEIAAKHLGEVIDTDGSPLELKKYEVALKEKYTVIFNFSNKIVSCCIKPFMLNNMIRVARKKESLNNSLTKIVLGLKDPPAKISASLILKKMFLH